MQIYKLNITFALAIVISSFVSVKVVAQDAIQPTLMILPSDNLLQRLDYLEVTTVGGVEFINQKYRLAFIGNSEMKFAIAEIQARFASRGFPLKDLETELKSLSRRTSSDIVDNIDQNQKALILTSAAPDIYLDLNYFPAGSGLNSSLAFEIRAIDAYSLRTIASASSEGVRGASSISVAERLVEQVEQNLNDLQSQIQEHFDDIRMNGREIRLRVVQTSNLAAGTFDFRRERCDGKPYTKLISDYIQDKSTNHSSRPALRTATELAYESFRIPLFDTQGYGISASDWTYELSTYIEGTCEVTAIDYTTSLGEGVLLIENN